MQVWTIDSHKKNNFLAGHPWVYANELIGNLRSVQPGEIVELQDDKKKFLAYGYANPHSKIAFRVLSREKENFKPDMEFIANKLYLASVKRQKFYNFTSHRLFFSEADGLPGIIIDCFFTDSNQVFVIQILTAGIEKLIKDFELLIKIFLKKCEDKKMSYFPWENTVLVLKRDGGSRKLEVLEILPTEIINNKNDLDLKKLKVKVKSAFSDNSNIYMYSDFISGQKTGMFLDQASNIENLAKYLKDKNKISVLDLFCYVGQWGTQLSSAIDDSKVTLVDASEQALDFAFKNVSQYSKNVTKIKMDIVEKCSDLPIQQFDIVICDPPALIKNKRDIHAGSRAYAKVNRYALRSVKQGGFFMSCSCSQPMSKKLLQEAILAGAKKEGIKLEFLAEGEQSPDHPILNSFPQGHYLKSLLYRVL